MRDTNYWERASSGNGGSQNHVKKPSAGRSIEEIIAGSRAGQPPTPYEVQQALAQLNAQAEANYNSVGSRKLTPAQKAQMDALLYEVPRNASKPMLYNDPTDAFPRPSIGSGLGDALKGLVGGVNGVAGNPVGSGVGAGVGGIAEGIKGIGASLFGDSGQAEETPEQLYQRLRKAAGEYKYSGPSAEDMVANEFDPQFALLDQLGKQTTSRYNANKADITKMYQGLVNDQTAARGQDKANFDAAVGATGKNYADASANITNNASAYSQAMAKELANLGIKEGAGDIVGGVQNNLQDNLGRLNTQGAGTKDLLTNLGANEYAYDTRNIGTAKQAGLNTQEQFLNDYMSRLDDQSNQRLQLTGQRGQALNNYGMQIQDLLQKGQGQFENGILEQFKSILGANEDNEDDYYKRAQLDLENSKFKWQQDQDMFKRQNSDQPTLNAYDTLSQRALNQYKDPTKARMAVEEIMSAYKNNPNPQNVADFLKGLDEDSLKNNPEMTSLVYDFISRILGEQSKYK